MKKVGVFCFNHEFFVRSAYLHLCVIKRLIIIRETRMQSLCWEKHNEHAHKMEFKHNEMTRSHTSQQKTEEEQIADKHTGVCGFSSTEDSWYVLREWDLKLFWEYINTGDLITNARKISDVRWDKSRRRWCVFLWRYTGFDCVFMCMMRMSKCSYYAEKQTCI